MPPKASPVLLASAVRAVMTVATAVLVDPAPVVVTVAVVASKVATAVVLLHPPRLLQPRHNTSDSLN